VQTELLKFFKQLLKVKTVQTNVFQLIKTILEVNNHYQKEHLDTNNVNFHGSLFALSTLLLRLAEPAFDMDKFWERVSTLDSTF